jgi:hypothetical protein
LKTDQPPVFVSRAAGSGSGGGSDERNTEDATAVNDPHERASHPPPGRVAAAPALTTAARPAPRITHPNEATWPCRTRQDTAMYSNPHIAGELARERQRDMRAQAHQQRPWHARPAA